MTASHVIKPSAIKPSAINPFKTIKRRRAATQLADHAEACEVRVLLSGVAIYPQQALAPEAETVAPAAKVSPLALTSPDYNGDWNIGFGLILDLSVKGNNPEKAKVKGAVVSMEIVGGSVKFKGKISNGIELNGKFRAELITGAETKKFKAEVSAQLTDSTHFAGMLSILQKGEPDQVLSITGTKI